MCRLMSGCVRRVGMCVIADQIVDELQAALLEIAAIAADLYELAGQSQRVTTVRWCDVL